MRTKDWIETEGTVGGVEVTSRKNGSTYSVVFTYKVEGHFYGGTFISYSNEYKVGDSLAVKYDPSDPDRNDLVLKDTIRHWVLVGIVVLAIVGYLVVQAVK